MSAKTILEKAVLETSAKVVILYDNFETLLDVKRQMERPVQLAGEAGTRTFHSWRFDMLVLGRSLEAYRALEAAVDADAIAIAVRTPRTAADVPITWLKQWAAIRQRREAKLLVLPIGPVTAFAAMIDGLRRLADFHKLPCVCIHDVPFLGQPAEGFKQVPGCILPPASQPLPQNRAIAA